jgi:hypothetical protein
MRYLTVRVCSGTLALTVALLISGTTSFHAAARKGSITVAPSAPTVETGKTIQLRALDSYGRTVAATWSSGNPAVASVSSTGTVQGVTAGNVTITATYNRAKASSAVRVVAPESPPPSTGGSVTLPFGPKQLPSSAFASAPWTGAYVNAGDDLATMTSRVHAAQVAGAHLILKLAPAHADLLNAVTGCFDMTRWKAKIDRLASFDFAPFVADGTVLGAELVNEPHASDWCLTTARRLTKAEVEEMAAYAKAIWPTLPVGAGRSDWVLANAPWAKLDFAHSQYHMRKGDPVAWRDQTINEARAAGVGHLMSLDYLAGQLDGSPMTATQLEYYGSVLAQDTYSCMLTGYLYDATYNARPGVMDAFTAIAWVANSHSAPPCYVGKVK